MDDVIERFEAYEYKGNGIFVPAINIKEFLLKIIEVKGPITRSELTKETGIPRTTIYDTLVKLLMSEQVRKFKSVSKTRGRPKIFYKIIEERMKNELKNGEIKLKEVKMNAVPSQ